MREWWQDLPVHFAPTRTGRLAYQVFGQGEHTVVAVPPTAQNIEVSWQYPAIRAMLERFGSFCRYVHFDKRGTGCSDRSSRPADIDERVDDLRAVMDHAGIDRAHLFGNSEGGPMTLLFAATYPDRVRSIVLFGTGPALVPPNLTADDLARQRERNRAYAALWGTPDSPTAAGFAPSLAAADPGFVAWHQRYERLAATQDGMVDLLELCMLMDVRELLPRIDVPTLVIHRTDDAVVPVSFARELADGLPDVRLFEQPGHDHFSYAGDVDGWMDEFERFVTGGIRSEPVGAALRPAVRVRTLGRFAVEVDGEEVATSAWGSRRARQLCKRLVAARGWPVTRDELFDLLWPDETDRDRLSARLSVQLSMVRRVLRGGVIADRESVRLDLGEVATDLEDLYRAADDEAVVAAFAGEFLPEDRYEDWTATLREEVRNRFALAAGRVSARAVAEGDTDRALVIAGRLLDLDPLDTAAHRLRVTALRAAGAEREADRAEAALAAVLTELGDPAPSGLRPHG
ncbi:MAG: alpha/beta fold hydrolase [Actinobacteria bacterium]|nr:alpha/beta fold hydrolase [Actinomycetota bacterium]